jgi:hypothetical protein
MIMKKNGRKLLEKYFEQAHDAFAEKFNLNDIGYKEGKNVLFFHILNNWDYKGWQFKVALNYRLVWEMWPVGQGRLERIILEKVSARLPIDGSIDDEGFLRTNLIKKPEKVSIVNIAEIFYSATDLYNKLLEDSEEDRESIYKEAEEKYEKCISRLLEKEGL